MTVYFELNNARAVARDLSQGLRLGATAQMPKASVMSLLPWRRDDACERALLKVCRVMEHLRPDSDDLTARQCGARRLFLCYLRARHQ
jgi:hypothetical protein